MAERGIPSQAELGRRSGVTQTNISNIERAAIYVRTDTLEKLAAALRTDASVLLAPPESLELIRLWLRCSAESQKTLIDVARSLSRSPVGESR